MHGQDCKPEPGPLPKRLIHVESVPPHLVLGEDVPSNNGRYATLSHCWGSTIPIRLLKSNTLRYSHKLSLELIPDTFRDAITLTQALRISYLWIDALCIVQDSPEEWETEALKMKDIYSGSSLNIAASDAHKSDDGCLSDFGFIESDKVNLFHVDDKTRDLALVVRVQVGDTRQATKGTILNTRGWVLQEQLLSRRMVSCMRSELHWECTKTYETEAGAQFEQTVSGICGIPRLKLGLLDVTPDRVWRIWVKDYSNRNFTFWKDRLPALSGITQHYLNVTGDIPLLGLWKSSLLQDLLWIRIGEVSSGSSEVLRATNLPSWSWLSCPAEVDFDIWQMTLRTNQEDPLVVVKDHCSLKDCSAEWNGSPFTSTIKEAQIVLEGPTMEVYIGAAQQHIQPHTPPHLEIRVKKADSGQYVTAGNFTGQFDFFEDSIPSTSYTALFLRSRQHQQTKRRREIFLILQQMAGPVGHALYRRVGIACFIGNKLEFRGASREQVILV